MLSFDTWEISHLWQETSPHGVFFFRKGGRSSNIKITFLDSKFTRNTGSNLYLSIYLSKCIHQIRTKYCRDISCLGLGDEQNATKTTCDQNISESSKSIDFMRLLNSLSLLERLRWDGCNLNLLALSASCRESKIGLHSLPSKGSENKQNTLYNHHTCEVY